MIRQIEFTLRPRSRGFHPITDEIEANLPPLPAAGLLHLFIKHTSAGLTLNENADPDVRTDLEAIFDRLVREREAYYIHTCEGDDDMPAHAKSTLVGTALTNGWKAAGFAERSSWRWSDAGRCCGFLRTLTRRPWRRCAGLRPDCGIRTGRSPATCPG